MVEMVFLLNFLSSLAFLALIAASLGLIFGQLGIVNIAQGEFVMVGAYTMFALREQPFLVAVVAAIAVGLALGWALERTVLGRLYERGFIATVLATWGIGIVLRQLADSMFTSTPQSVPSPIPGSMRLLGITYPSYRIVSALVILTALVFMLGVAYKTSFGLRIRASIDNMEMASILGISPRRMYTIVFTIGTSLAVLAGALLAPLVGITPTMGLSFLAPAFFAVLLGRPGTIGGPVFGAALVTLLSSALRRHLTATMAETLLFAALVLVIAIRPQGLQWTALRWKDLGWSRT